MPVCDGKIENSSLSVRAKNALINAGYTNLEECLDFTEDKLSVLKNIGRKTSREIFECLKQYRSLSGQPDKKTESVQGPASLLTLEAREHLIYALALPIAEINFSFKVKKILGLLRIYYLKALVIMTPNHLIMKRYIGSKVLGEITALLSLLGLSLSMQLTPEISEAIDDYISQNEGNPNKLVKNYNRIYPSKAKALKEFSIKKIGPERAAYYTHCFKLYKQGGTLKYVAKEMGLTRERIRQILVKGTDVGLFTYSGHDREHDYPYIPKDKLLADIYKYASLYEVARINRISKAYLNRLIISYHISSDIIDNLWAKKRKQKVIDEYISIKNKIGHNPTTTELQTFREGRSLGSRIRRYWGTIERFRNELNIPAPPPFRKALRPWLEHKSRVALIKRMQDLDLIRDCLIKNTQLSGSEIARQFDMNPNRVLRLLQILVSTGEADHEGTGKGSRFKLHN